MLESVFENSGPNPILSTAFFVAAALLPFFLLSVTSFLKFSIVFTILRNALGAQQVPSVAVSSLLAMVLTIFVMHPVGESVYGRWQEYPGTKFEETSRSIKKTGKESASSLSHTIERAIHSAEPLRDFLRNHAADREREYFATLINRAEPKENFATLMSAFLLTEIREAFAIGFSIFLPFLAVDLIVTNILVALGMTMLTPTTVSLPLKLILFVASDGWFLLSKALVEGYQ